MCRTNWQILNFKDSDPAGDYNLFFRIMLIFYEVQLVLGWELVLPISRGSPLWMSIY